MLVSHDSIGGAIVRRPFSREGAMMGPGARLTREECLAIPIRNLRALIASGALEVWSVEADVSQAPMERHVVSIGFGRYDVIEGRQLNDKPMSKEEAEALACAAQQN